MNRRHTTIGAFIFSALCLVVAGCSGSSGAPTQPINPAPTLGPTTAPSTQNLYVTANLAGGGAGARHIRSSAVRPFGQATTAELLQFAPPLSGASTPSATQPLSPFAIGVAADASYVVAGSDITDGSSIAIFNQPFATQSGPAATITNNSGPLNLAAFDASGNFWVTEGSNINEYTPPRTSSSTPAHSISVGGAQAVAVAFDGSNNLYATVLTDGASLLNVYPPSATQPSVSVQVDVADIAGVAVSGNTVAVAVFGIEGGVAAKHHGLVAMRRTRAGAHPRASQNAGEILLYTLPLSNSSTPSATIPFAQSPIGLAFDAAGNLYAAEGFIGGGVAVFNAPLSSSSTPAFTIPVNSNAEPVGVAFGP